MIGFIRFLTVAVLACSQLTIVRAQVVDGERPDSPTDTGYVRMLAVRAEYAAIEKAGGWPSVPSGVVLRLGDEVPAVVDLRNRLAVTGEIEGAAAARSQLFDAELDAAVRAFQARHGLEVDGIVGPQTLASLNTSVSQRLAQIDLNLERWRKQPPRQDSTYVEINIPAFQLTVVRNGRPSLRMKVIVGKPGTPTPTFDTRITEVVLAPYWYVPKSIEVNEILPKLRIDGAYLQKHHMRRLPSGTLRQDPGPTNPMGSIKFTIPNPYGVGLHDTSEPHLFAHTTCAFSHGCMRVERPVDLALFLLQGTGWTRARIIETVGSWEERRLPLDRSVPLFVLYRTAWVGEDGNLHFRPDIYGRDRRALDTARSKR